MLKYKVIATTDGKYLGKLFTVDELEMIFDIEGVDEGIAFSQYTTIKKTGNRIMLANTNYTIRGVLVT